mgnify:CR=1 FL=1|tara:strand:+ start:12350 stop:13681 length:1332 start_codon:yes stop_codon:yes gene_type:complete
MSKINASPTKEFFVNVIGRDLSLYDAAKDLVDNCVDGARRLRPDGNFEGLSVEIALNAEHFVIVDNCGGIPVSIARDHAFRFGRTAGAPAVEGSIGQFGVGMKRALFMMGDVFEINSVAPDSHFKLRVDVNEWMELVDENGKEIWEFEFTEEGEGENNAPEACGTTLTVTQLHAGVAADFASQGFRTRLILGLQEAHAASMERGLEIELNDFLLQHQMPTLLASSLLIPMKVEQVFRANPDEGVPAPVTMTLWAGISDSSLNDAGWYLACNGRQIVRADKSALTGWATVLDEIRTPQAHNQFSRFRGYVHFESDNATGLPWNTSKSGVDTESLVYQWARREMVAALRQVIDFLNAVAAEQETESVYLRNVMRDAVPARLASIRPSVEFVFPVAPPADDKPKTIKVQFDRSIEDVDFVRAHFEVNSAGRAGQAVFDYFLERERA